MFGHPFFIPLIVTMTSVACCLGGLRSGRRTLRGLKQALVEMLEQIGLAIAFFVLNSVVALGVIAIANPWLPGFLSPYLADDVVLVFLSTLQALTFWAWDTSRPRPPSTGDVPRLEYHGG